MASARLSRGQQHSEMSSNSVANSFLPPVGEAARPAALNHRHSSLSLFVTRNAFRFFLPTTRNCHRRSASFIAFDFSSSWSKNFSKSDNILKICLIGPYSDDFGLFLAFFVRINFCFFPVPNIPHEMTTSYNSLLRLKNRRVFPVLRNRSPGKTRQCHILFRILRINPARIIHFAERSWPGPERW